jgi:hypothetical protein
MRKHAIMEEKFSVRPVLGLVVQLLLESVEGCNCEK